LSDDRIDVPAKAIRVDDGQMTPSSEEDAGPQACATKRPQFSDWPPVPCHRHGVAGGDAVDHVSAAIAQVSDGHRVHGCDGITGETSVKGDS
jgi:hypothetical protein